MMTLMLAAALAAQAPAAPGAADPMARHPMSRPMGEGADHKDQDCSKDMAAKHEGHDTDHAHHAGR